MSPFLYPLFSIFALTENALDEVKNVDAVYFQGAVLDPLKVLERSNDRNLLFGCSRRDSTNPRPDRTPRPV